jgi:hypothetical protein
MATLHAGNMKLGAGILANKPLNCTKIEMFIVQFTYVQMSRKQQNIIEER